MKIKKILKSEFFYFVFLLILTILIKIPTMNLDYYWDEITFAGQSKFISENGFLSVPPGYMVHVPFLTWLAAINYNLFGESPFISHFLIAIFSFIGVYFTYLLGKEIFNKKIGVFSSLLLLFSPIYFAISGQFLFDVPLTSMTLVTLYFGLKKRILFYLPSAIILVLTKEPGVLVIFSLIIYYFLKKEKLNKIIIFSIPISFLFLWELFFWFQTNNILSSSGTFAPYQGIALIIQRAISNLYQILFWNYNWILTLFLAIYIFNRCKLKKKIFPEESLMLILIILFYWVLFSFAPIPVLPRYLLPIVPIFIIFSTYSIDFLLKNKSYIMFLIILLLFISCYKFNWGIKGLIQDPVFHSTYFYQKPLTSIENGELSLDYIDIVKLEQEATLFILNNFPNSTITVSWPLVDNVTIESNIGYKQWKKYNITILQPSQENIKKSNLIVYESCCLDNDIKDNLKTLKPLIEFEKNNKHVFILTK